MPSRPPRREGRLWCAQHGRGLEVKVLCLKGRRRRRRIERSAEAVGATSSPGRDGVEALPSWQASELHRPNGREGRTFSYKANDGTFDTVDSNVATVSIHLEPIGHAPIAKDLLDSGPGDLPGRARAPPHGLPAGERDFALRVSSSGGSDLPVPRSLAASAPVYLPPRNPSKSGRPHGP